MLNDFSFELTANDSIMTNSHPATLMSVNHRGGLGRVVYQDSEQCFI